MRPLPAGLPPSLSFAATLIQPGTGHLMVPCENAEMQLFDTQHNRHISLFKARVHVHSFVTFISHIDLSYLLPPLRL